MEARKTSRGLALLFAFCDQSFQQCETNSVLFSIVEEYACISTRDSLASAPVSWLLGHWKSVNENKAVIQVACGMKMMEEKVVGNATKIISWRLFWHKLLILKWTQCAVEFP